MARPSPALVLGLLLLATGLNGAAAQAASAASPDFELFRRLCIDTHAQQGAAVAQADRDGFATPAADVIAETVANMQMSPGTQIRSKVSSDQLLILAVGAKPSAAAGQPTKVEMCALSIAKPDVTAEGDAKAWVGVAAARDADGVAFYVFNGDTAHHRSTATLSEEAALAEIRAGDMQTAAVSHTDQASLLMYGSIAPGAAPPRP